MSAHEASPRQFRLRTLFLFTFLICLNLAGATTFGGAPLIVTVGMTFWMLAAFNHHRLAVAVLLFWMFGLTPLLMLFFGQ